MHIAYKGMLWSNASCKASWETILNLSLPNSKSVINICTGGCVVFVLYNPGKTIHYLFVAIRPATFKAFIGLKSSQKCNVLFPSG